MRWPGGLLLIVLFGLSGVAVAEEAAEREAWRDAVAAQRARADAQRQLLKADLAKRKADALLNPADSGIELARRASDQVLNDSSLQRGDIVSTKDGLFMFVGRGDGEHTPNDFVPVSPDAAPR